MKLYLLERIGDTNWDQHAGFVIRASSPKRARTMAGKVLGSYEDALMWLDPTRSTCVVLKKAGPEEVILEDYRAG